MIDLLLCLALPQADVPDPAAELARACMGLSTAASYTFEQRTESVRAAGLDGLGAGAEAEVPPTLVGRYVQGQPVHLSLGETQAWRSDDGTITQRPDGAWAYLDPRSAFERRGPRGGEDRRAPGEGRGGGQRGERGGGGMRAAFALMTVQLPHEMAGGIDAKVTAVEKAEAEGGYVFSATLTPEAARSYSGMGRMGRMGRSGPGGPGGRGGEPGGGMEFSGTFRCTVDAAGTVQQVVVESTMRGRFGEREIERTTKTTCVLSKIGATELEVPAEVTATLAKGPPAHLNDDEF